MTHLACTASSLLDTIHPPETGSTAREDDPAVERRQRVIRETERQRDRERECVCELTQWGATLVIQLRERERERGSTDDGPTTTVVMS